MGNERLTLTKKHFLKLFIIALSLFVAMLICALLGYSFVKIAAPADKENEPAAKSEQESVFTSETQENLTVTEIPSPSPERDIPPDPDKNDYLVIWENDVVNLYLINTDGDIIFSKVLEFSPEALTEEDKNALTEGIILKTEEELALLMEDYSS